MEGVGARLGRSSTRYGPATVFTGPVRKWKKKWIHVTPPHTAASSNNHHNHHHQHHQANGNSSSNGNNNNASHILLYKWTPISQSHNTAGDNNSNGDAKDEGDAAEAEEEPPRRKMKYIPVAVLEEQNNEGAEEQIGDEVKPAETDPDAAAEPTSKSDRVDEKPDINDVPTEENQVSKDTPVRRQDLNESTSDLSLNLNDCDGDEDPEEAKDQTRGRAVG